CRWPPRLRGCSATRPGGYRRRSPRSPTTGWPSRFTAAPRVSIWRPRPCCVCMSPRASSGQRDRLSTMPVGRAQEVVDALPDGVVLAGANGRVTLISRVAADMLGVSTDDVGRDLSEVLALRDQD